MIGAGRRQTSLRRRGAPAMARRLPTARKARRWRLSRPRWVGPRLLVVMLVLGALAAGGWVWLRNSSLVAVRRVTIAGVSGPDAGQIRSALRAAAQSMTTLNVRLGALRTAIAPYPVVKHLQVSTDFPHGLRIDVVEQVPVAMISVGETQVPVSADGTLLRDANLTGAGALPTIALDVAPGGGRVGGSALDDVRLLAAAPYAFLARVSQASSDPVHGLIAQLRNGPKIYFGVGSQLRAKWAAATAVLAAASSAGADYIDVTDPSRPAAGSGSDTADSPASTPSEAAVTAPADGG
jgi:cell division protein FtsQ